MPRGNLVFSKESEPDLVRIYLKEIGKIQRLTRDEEIFYGKQVQSMMNLMEAKTLLEKELGHELTEEEWAAANNLEVQDLERILLVGKKAKKKMIECNLRLVVSVAKKYQHRNMELLDLIQEGTIGLQRGVEKFDPTKGYRFSTYAYWWIRQAITRAIPQSSRVIRLPIHMIEKLNQLKKVRRQVSQNLKRKPTTEEIAKAMNIEISVVEHYLTLIDPIALSLNIKPVDHTETELHEFMRSPLTEPEEYIDKILQQEEVNRIIKSCLKGQQLEVIMLRYGLRDGKERSLTEIGKTLGCSKENARRVYNAAIEKLKGKKKMLISYFS
jgi:RNA polymerase nonessential primary-like sigma factor